MSARKTTEELFKQSDSGDEPPGLVTPTDSSGEEKREEKQQHGSKDTRLSIIATPFSQRAKPRVSDEDFLAESEEVEPCSFTTEEEESSYVPSDEKPDESEPATKTEQQKQQEKGSEKARWV